MAAEGGTVLAPRCRHRAGDRQRRHRLRHSRSVRQRPHRDHRLPRLRRRLVGPVAVRCHRRSRCAVPGSATARAAADVRPPPDRPRLRRRQGGFDRHDPVRLLVPAAGRPVPRQHAHQRRRARLLHRPPLRAGPGADLGAPPGRLLRRRRMRALVAHRSTHRRRLGDHRPLPHHVDRLRGHRRRLVDSDGRFLRRPGEPVRAAALPARLGLLRSEREGAAADRVEGGGALAVACYLAVVLTGLVVLWRRYRWVER